jgi:DNA ligase (NAD+)
LDKNAQIFFTLYNMKVTEFLTKLRQLSRNDLLSIKGIGETLTQNYDSFLNSSRYQLLISKFEELESNDLTMSIIQEVKRDNQNLPLSNETVCITGTFEISRSEIKTKLEENGAKVVDSITSATTILLAGDKAGSKLEKAKKQNIRIIQNLTELLQ